MDAPTAATDLETDETQRQIQPEAQESAKPHEAAARLPGEVPEGLGVESLEDRVLLSADAAGQDVGAPSAAPPEEPPALVGSPVAGENAGANGSQAEPIVTDGRPGASTADVAEVAAELVKTPSAATGGTSGEQKQSHSTESGEIGERKNETPGEQAGEVNESERLERGARPENQSGDEPPDGFDKTANRRRTAAGQANSDPAIVSGDAEAAAAASAAPEAIAARMIAADAAVEAHGDLAGESLDAGRIAVAAELRQESIELSGVVDHLGSDRAQQVMQGEKLAGGAEDADQPALPASQSGQTVDAEQRAPARDGPEKPAAAGDSAAALAKAHAEHVMAELQAADEANAVQQSDAVQHRNPQQPGAPAQHSQRVDAPQAHDAFFAATPDLAAYAGDEAAVVAPVSGESSAGES